ncbi:hypothetical protein FHU38_000980 [Saccharomonospora amisosensis]|uniref:Uncharacterized protein n=1 Tax=Saccharomonospora amisosensis TaxID=1128677 RepID=A0A7X5UMA6_9PSEU|nr:hypothetical protein [Saccharomonospora amisosensis]NIJ10636.1 hypothetical protein [Saccharomonospora amisosensis]
MTYYIELGFTVRTDSPDALDQDLDNLMDALVEEPGATDADLAAELSTGNVWINMYIDADDDQAAFGQALVVARSAIHKAGGFTGGWIDGTDRGGLPVEDTYNVRVQPAELVDC